MARCRENSNLPHYAATNRDIAQGRPRLGRLIPFYHFLCFFLFSFSLFFFLFKFIFPFQLFFRNFNNVRILQNLFQFFLNMFLFLFCFIFIFSLFLYFVFHKFIICQTCSKHKNNQISQKTNS